MQAIDVKRFFRGMNQDLDARLLPDGSYVDAMNIKVSNAASGRVGSLTNLHGIENISSTSLMGLTSDEVVGMFSDRINNLIYVMIKNGVEAPDRILKYNPVTGAWSILVMTSALGFASGRLIRAFDVVEDNIAFTDGVTNPRYVSTSIDYLTKFGISAYAGGTAYTAGNLVKSNGIVYEALQPTTGNAPSGDLTATSYWGVSATQGFTESDITMAVPVPNAAPTFVISTDDAFAANFIVGKFFQFKYRFVYDDNRKSVFSPISRLAYSESDYLSPENKIDTANENNVIIVSIPKSNANKLVKKIEVAARSGNSGAFGIIHTEELESSFWSTGFSFSFYNNGASIAISDAESNQIYDDQPRSAGAQRYTNNRLLYADTKNGFDKPSIEISTSVIKKVLPSTSAIEDDSADTSVLTDATGATLAALFPTYTPTAGDIIEVRGRNSTGFTPPDLYFGFGLVEVVVEPGWGWADIVAKILEDEFWHDTSTFNVYNSKDYPYPMQPPPNENLPAVQVEDILCSDQGAFQTVWYPDENSYLTYVNDYFNFRIFAGGSVHDEIFKSGARYQVGLQYHDEFGRTNGVITSETAQVYIPTIGERNLSVSGTPPAGTSLDAGGCSILVSISNTPPAWAKYFSVVWANTYKDAFTLECTIVQAKDGSPTTRCIADISSIKTSRDNQKTNITYTWAKGDRIRFITIDAGAGSDAETTEWAQQVYDVEIISELDNYSGTDGKQSIEFFYPTGLDAANLVGARIEIYRPSSTFEPDQVLFTESPEIYEISNSLHGGLIPQHAAGAITGVPYSGVFASGSVKYIKAAIADIDAALEVGDEITMTGTYTDVLDVEAVEYKSDGLVWIYVESSATWVADNAAASGTISYTKAATSPAIIILSNGDAYLRPRTLQFVGSEVAVMVEDYSMSDFIASEQYSKGRMTAIIDQQEQQNPATIFYSEPLIPNTYINGINRIYPDLNFEEYSKNFGKIVLIHDEGSSVVVFQEDKVSQVMIDQSLTYDAAGQNSFLNSTETVLSKAIPYAGEYGMQSPFSFAFFGNRKYFTDVARGVQCRLSIDGITEISRYGMRGWFYDACKSMIAAGDNKVAGMYDPVSDEYIVSFTSLDKTICFNEELGEGNGGYSSFLSEQFSCGCNLDNKTFYAYGKYVYESNKITGVNKNQIKFGQNTSNLESYVQVVSNIEPDLDKAYLAIIIDGNDTWDVVITTEEGQQSTLAYDLDFRMKESEYHAAFLRDINTPNMGAAPNALLNGDRIRSKDAKIKLTMTAARAGTAKYIKAVKIVISKS